MKINEFNCTIYHVTKENGHKIRLNCNGNCWNSSTLIFFNIFDPFWLESLNFQSDNLCSVLNYT